MAKLNEGDVVEGLFTRFNIIDDFIKIFKFIFYCIIIFKCCHDFPIVISLLYQYLFK